MQKDQNENLKEPVWQIEDWHLSHVCLLHMTASLALH